MRASTWALGALAAAALAVPFGLALDQPGSDDRASAVAAANRPGFTPHAEPVFTPSDQAEPRLFALQAGLGAGGVVAATGALWVRARRSRAR